MKYKQILHQYNLEYASKMYPNFPKHLLALPKYQSGANGLTKMIIDYINFSGGFAERINTSGRYIVGGKPLVDINAKGEVFVQGIGSVALTKGKWIKSTSTAGSSDISSTYKGRSIKIEVKWKKDRQSDAQKEYQKRTELAQGVYMIARDFETWADQWHDIIKNY